MTAEEVSNNINVKNLNKFIRNNLILSISFLSVVSDLVIGLASISQYYLIGRPSWAIITFCFIFFPSVILQIISIKLYLVNRNMLPLQWLFHSTLLGIFYRYISAFRKCVRSYKTKSCLESNLVKTEIVILKNLYLFKSFLECAPQLVLQLYFMTITPFSLILTGALASTSAFSLTWSLILHTNARHSGDFGLLFLILWRVGMITARISALVLCAYTCGPWIILFIGSHWLAMTLWITYQKASMDDKDKKGEFHSALFGVIYCFCFFSVKTGQTRSKAVILNSLLLFQNLIFLTVFLMSFSTRSPKLAVLSFITVIFGSLLGITSFLIYNTFYHPRGPFKCMTHLKELICCKTRSSFNKQTVLSRSRGKSEVKDSKPENEQLHDVQSPSDSIIIIEENPTANSFVDEPNSQISTGKNENIYDEPKSGETEKNAVELKFSAALKRRAICSSVDLTRFLDEKPGDDAAALESKVNAKIVAAEETPSEILSTHDYENLCAVNIAREPWGIRSWRVYSDIETWRHDDSVFNERRLDNMTTSSEYSGKIEDKDSLTTAEDDLMNCEIDTNSDKTSVNFVPPFPASMLHTIFEERESPSSDETKGKCNSESALVATIDKICLYTPLRIRSGKCNEMPEVPSGRPVSEMDKVKCWEENGTGRDDRIAENDRKEAPQARKEKIQKFNIFKERYETNRYQVCGKTTPGNGAQKNDNNSLNGSKRNFSFKDKSSLLVQMLTPTKLEKRKFAISPAKR